MRLKENIKKFELGLGVKKLKVFRTFLLAMFIGMTCITNVYAADDPLSVVNNLSNFIFGLIRAIGMAGFVAGSVQYRSDGRILRLQTCPANDGRVSFRGYFQTSHASCCA